MQNGVANGNGLGEAASVDRVFGVPNDEVNAWGITKKTAGKWVRCTHPDASGTHVKEWPLRELTRDTIRERWGHGEYRVCWFSSDPTNEDPTQRWRAAGGGPAFVFEEQTPTRVAAPAAAPPPSGFEQAALFMRMADERVSSQLRGLGELASLIGVGRQPAGGLDASSLQLILEKQQLQFQAFAQTLTAQIDGSVRELRSELASVRDELDELDERPRRRRDDEPAQTTTSGFSVKPGESLTEQAKAAALNWAIQNPGKVFEVLGKIPGAVSEIAKISAQQQAQQQQHAAQLAQGNVTQFRRPVARAVAAPQPPPNAPANAAPFDPPEPGLNAFMRERTQQAAASAGVPPVVVGDEVVSTEPPNGAASHA